MSSALVFLAEGFEEIEAIGTIDILRRGGVNTLTVSIYNHNQVTGSHGISVVADHLISEIDLSAYDALILPGGMPGTTNLGNCKTLTDALKVQNNKGKVVAAICAAPTVLGALNIADGHKVTCYPGCEDPLYAANVTGLEAEVDGNIVTGRGPGTVFDFALKILHVLCGYDVAQSVASSLTTAERLGY